MTARPPLPPAFLESLGQLLGQRLSTSPSVCAHHGRDESIFAAMPPDAVAYAQNTDEVVAIVRLCRQHRVPLVPYGAGSSLEGHTLATQGGLTLNLQQMDQVIAIHADDQCATVQPGVTRKALNAALRDEGLFFPIDPGADATIGGMCATRASGTNAVRYGTMRENVLNLTVVTADGEVITTARRAKKSAAGYDLTRLFIGSEGTLGVIVEATVRLYPLPESVMAAVCAFPDIHSAVDVVTQTIQLGVPSARCEFVDSMAIRALNHYSKTGLPEQPHLFLSSTAANPACASRWPWCRPWRRTAVARSSSGLARPKSARGSGRRATTSTLQRCSCAPGAAQSSPMCVCPCPAWPTASRRPRKTCSTPASWRPWWAMWGMAIFMCRCWWTPACLPRSKAPRR